MESHRSALDPELLLEHAAWARRLARELVADAAAADDVVQEAWLAAARKPPEPTRPFRQWLGTVLRNAARQRARSEGRRAERELAGAREERLPGPDELTERLESQRVLVEELARLAEPFRSTVLLRFFEDLEPAQIAERQGLPGGTVRWRLKRGLDELRTRLDARFGDRRSWAMLLVPLGRMATPPAAPAGTGPAPMVPSSGPTAALTGAMVMHVGVKVAAGVAAGIAVVMGVALSGLWTPEIFPWSREAPLEVAFRPLEVAQPAPQAPSEAPAAPEREAIVARAEPASAPVEEPQQAERSTMVLRAGAFDEAGTPLAGAVLRWASDLATASPPSGADGALRLEVEVLRLEGDLVLLVERAGFATQSAQARFELGGETYLGNFRLAPGGAIAGRVVDADGRGVPHAEVSVGDASLSRGEVEQRRYEHYVEAPPRALTDADGSFRLHGVGEGFWRVWASGAEWLASASAPVEVRAGLESSGVEIALEPLTDARQVRGVVLDPDGAPVPHARLDFTRRDAGTTMSGDRSADERGRFEWTLRPSARMELTASDPEGRFGPATARDLAPGAVDVELRLTRQREVTLLVRDASGAPVERFGVELAEVRGSDEEEHLGIGAGDLPEPEHHAGGSTALALPSQAFVLVVRAPGFALHRSAPLQPIAVGDELEVALAPLPGLRGRVVSDGAPVEGALVELLAVPEEGYRLEAGPFALRLEPEAFDRARSGSDGAFLLTPRERRRFVVRAERAGFAPAEVGPFEIDPALGRGEVEIELGQGGALEGRVLVPPGPDAAGTLVGVSRGDGRARTQRVGADGTFRFERLTPGAWQVRKLESEGTGWGMTFGGGEVPPIAWDCVVEAGGTARFDLDLTGAGRTLLAGSVHIDGAAPTGWRAELCEGDGWNGESVARGAVDPSGAFELVAPRPGTYRLCLVTTGGDDGERMYSAALELGAGDTEWSQDLPVGALTVENVLAPNLAFVLTRPDGLMCLIALLPDAQGRCELERVPAGKARIARLAETSDPASWPTVADVEIKKGDRAQLTLP
jgi:RNA polymerase sigma factor (sigma-70 family)